LRDGQLYLATDVGLFTAKAGSTSWKQFGTGLPQVAVRSMQLSRDGRYLLAGAYGRGGWVYDFGAAATSPPTVVPQHPSAGGVSSSSGGAGNAGSHSHGLASTGGSRTLPLLALLVLAAAAVTG